MMLRSQADKMSDVVYRRCKYVIEEISRVEVACEVLLQDDLVTFGQKMYETHDGLQNEYEVSCEELDFLVDITRQDDKSSIAKWSITRSFSPMASGKYNFVD
ncbi:MAG: hypothetical protein MUF45_09180 [Spirosomaceae bacterium]|nr:hypothetical protein [Spirosomataceae bacterium]